VRKYYPANRNIAIDVLHIGSIHLRGIKPRYRNLRTYSDASLLPFNGDLVNKTGNWITPTGWQAKYQPYFEQQILNRYPTVREERFHWQCSIYPSFAQSLFLQAIDEIRGAVFQENNFEYKFSSEGTAAYLYEKKFNGLDFYDWVTNSLCLHILGDPNGYIVTMPEFWDTETGTVGEPTCTYVSSEALMYADSALIVWQYGETCYIADDTAYYKIKYDKRKKKYDLNNVEVLPHTLQELPATICGGYEMHDSETGKYYLSYFSGAYDWANIAIRQFIDTEALNKDIIPITQMVQIECNACHGTGSVPVPCADDNMGGCTATCGTCNGEGIVKRNLGDVISIDPSQIIDGKLPQYLQYISGDVNNLRYADERFAEMYDRFREALYLKFIDEAQSGVAKSYDRDRLYKFLSNFTDNIFDVITDALVRIDALLNNTEANQESVTVRRPSHFVLKSEADMREELGELIKANAPATIVQAVADTLVITNAQSPVTEKKVKFLSLYDPLRYHSDQQKAYLVTVAGVFTRNDLIKSVRCENELNKLIDELSGEWFLAADNAQIASRIDAALQQYYQPEVEQMPLIN